MNIFYLVRHGQKTSHGGNSTLTEAGKIQSKKTAKYLFDKKILKIISSTYKRTTETSKIIDSLLNVGIEYDDRLKERMFWGSVENQNLEDFLKEWKYSDLDRNFKPKAGISSNQAGVQVEHLLSELVSKYPNRNLVLVTSGPTIIDLLRNLFSDSDLERQKPGVLKNKFYECSVTILQYNNNVFTLNELGSIEHLV